MSEFEQTPENVRAFADGLGLSPELSVAVAERNAKEPDR